MRAWRPALALAALLALVGPAAPLANVFATVSAPSGQLFAGLEERVLAAQHDLDTMNRQPVPTDPIGAIRGRRSADEAEFRFREGVRHQQNLIKQAAVADEASRARFLSEIPAGLRRPVQASIDAMRAFWRLGGNSDPTEVPVRRLRLAGGPVPPDRLMTFYQEAAGRSRIDWSYLAAINMIESDFCRNPGTSSAGARGPMQFLPSTWQEFGEGGDIMSPHDSILAAARYLARFGAPGNMRRAIFAYNHDNDYVDAVIGYATAMQADPGWMRRFFYWNTYG